MTAAAAFDPEVESTNFSKIRERKAYVTSTPEFQARMAQQNARDHAEYPQIVAADPERDFKPAGKGRVSAARSTTSSGGQGWTR